MAKLIKNDQKWTSIVSLAFLEIYANEPTNLTYDGYFFGVCIIFFIKLEITHLYT
jgi:hypothetical protein